jgi:hypothetical protein
MNREDVYEAAMLAKMVGSHLMGVDRLTSERTSNPANKINIENFIAPLIGKQAQPSNFIDPNSVSPDMLKAYENVNQIALQTIPDPIQNIASAPVNFEIPKIENISNQNINSNVKISSKNKENAKEFFVDKKDITQMKTSLKNIEKILSNMYNLMKTNADV